MDESFPLSTNQISNIPLGYLQNPSQVHSMHGGESSPYNTVEMDTLICIILIYPYIRHQRRQRMNGFDFPYTVLYHVS